jgi:hypothetical protein
MRTRMSGGVGGAESRDFPLSRSLRWRSLNGHESESRIQAKADLKPSARNSPEGRVSIARWNPEGHEVKYRVVIDGGCPEDEPVGQRWGRSSLHYEGEGVLIRPPHQGVCGRHGTEERRVTSGGLTGSLGGARVSRPISESETASDALSVDGRLCSTTSAVKAA